MKFNMGATHRMLAGIAIAAALGAMALPSLAKPHGQPDAGMSEHAQRFSVSGSIAAVNYDANSLTVESAGKRFDIVITPTTAIDFRGEIGSIADIHRGRKLSVSGVVRGGTMIAQTISLR